jgi:protein gp37
MVTVTVWGLVRTFGAAADENEWIRECRKHDIPFFFRQWDGVRKDLTGRQLNGKTYDDMPARVAA